jgi:hypothetical protein
MHEWFTFFPFSYITEFFSLLPFFFSSFFGSREMQFAVVLVAVMAVLAGQTVADTTVIMGCIEESSFLVHEHTESPWLTSPSSWDWMGNMPYNPVLLERFRQTAHLEGPVHHCVESAPMALAVHIMQYVQWIC